MHFPINSNTLVVSCVAEIAWYLKIEFLATISSISSQIQPIFHIHFNPQTKMYRLFRPVRCVCFINYIFQRSLIDFIRSAELSISVILASNWNLSLEFTRTPYELQSAHRFYLYLRDTPQTMVLTCFEQYQYSFQILY